MIPVRGIETRHGDMKPKPKQTFKLMIPVRGIETLLRLPIQCIKATFQINDSRSRD